MSHPGQRAPAVLIPAAWLALAALTRVPLSGRSLGESDCARYRLGLHQWLRQGPGAPFIYAKELSPGYYALAAALQRRSGAHPAALLSALSLLAALLSAPLLYALGRRLASPPAAAAGAALFLFSPAFWWLGIEPHPQGLAFLGVLAALAAFLAWPGWRGHLAAALALAAALLFKSDLILLAGAFPALAYTRARAAAQAPVRAAARALAPPALALALFLLARNPLLGLGWRQSQQLTASALRQFLALPHGQQLLRQLLPFATAPGVATTALLALGATLGLRRPAWRRRWLLPLAAWVLPSSAFWLLLRGNNVRHLAALALLPLWAALEALLAWPRLAPRPAASAALLALAVLAANLPLPPPSSNLTLYPSANVPASVSDLAARSADLHAWLAASLLSARARGLPAPCYLGNATLPYLELALLHSHPRRVLRPLAAPGHREALQVALAPGLVARFLEVNRPAQFLAAQSHCRRAFGAPAASLEFSPAARRARFFGREWRSLPWARRWYPAAAARPDAVRH
ncbi:MAG TPA: hypothetical protein VMV31_09210 [Terriglobales bacterium]|nr:hypothetical protein [Terriglobales bacterium]